MSMPDHGHAKARMVESSENGNRVVSKSIMISYTWSTEDVVWKILEKYVAWK